MDPLFVFLNAVAQPFFSTELHMLSLCCGKRAEYIKLQFLSDPLEAVYLSESVSIDSCVKRSRVYSPLQRELACWVHFYVLQLNEASHPLQNTSARFNFHHYGVFLSLLILHADPSHQTVSWCNRFRSIKFGKFICLRDAFIYFMDATF